MELAKLNIILICLLVLTGCSTHFFLEGSALDSQGAYMEAAELYEKAAKGKLKVEAYEALIPIYTELNAHESALRSLDSLDSNIGLTKEQLFMKAEAHMALAQYDLAKDALEELDKSPEVISRLNSINTISSRQADSIYYTVRKIDVININDEAPDIVSAALPHRINEEIYFIAESPRVYKNQRQGKDTYIDDYTGNRLMDLWHGEIVDTSGFGGSIKLLASPMIDVNTEFHDGIVAHHKGDSIGVLGKTYIKPEESFIEKANRQAGYKIFRPIQLFHSELVIDSIGNKSWSTKDRLQFCDDDYMFAHPALSPDGNTLYFTSDIPGGFGGMDIWKSEKINGMWESPENLGGVINTTRDEAFPTMRHKDTLYFSSNGHLGLGGLDIVYATRLEGQEWHEVFDGLPSPINSSRDDFGLQLDLIGNGGIFASDRTGIDALYQYSSYEPKIILNVETVHASDFSPWGEVDAVLEMLDSKFAEEFVTDSAGKWSMIVERGETFMIQCPSSLGYSAKPFDTPEDQKIKEITIVIPIPIVIPMGCMDAEAINYDPNAIVDDGLCQYYVPEPAPELFDEEFESEDESSKDEQEEIITIPDEIIGCTIPHACNYDPAATKNDGSCEYESCMSVTEDIEELEEGDVVELKIHWDLDKYFVRESDKPEIIRFANYLKSNPDLNVLLLSHCDMRATHKYNDRLSQNRANAIKRALIDEGVLESRLASYGASEMFPIIPCETAASCSEEEHQINRRSVANILNSGEKVVIHRVKKGETLYGLNKDYGVSYEQIKSWNALVGNSMRPGQDILIYLP